MSLIVLCAICQRPNFVATLQHLDSVAADAYNENWYMQYSCS